MSSAELRPPRESPGLVFKMEEIWKDYPQFEGLYQVSNFGRVKSLNYHREKRESILNPIIDIGGYEIVKLCKDGKVYPHRVHLMVASVYVQNPENKPYVDHIDTNRRNNRADNLRWCTMKENHNNPASLLNHGNATKKSWNDGLHDTQKKEVLQYTINGILVKRHSSIKDAGFSIGKYSTNIGYCVKHPDRHHTAHGFLWCYADDTERIKEIESLSEDSSPKLF